MDKQLTRFSKFISLVLRHEPQKYGLTLDPHGWVAIDDLLASAERAGVRMTRTQLEQVVAENDKQRFAISDDRLRIRARQGHSVSVDLELPPLTPPDRLYHGTVDRFIASIRQQGLIRGSRQHVHLSATLETAIIVGQRRGAPVILTVDSAAMHHDGYLFYRSENGVWLTDAVPARYLSFPEA
ncbi:MAG: RNA 2'-phosphotransferase [Roseiflexaceae bacterium]